MNKLELIQREFREWLRQTKNMINIKEIEIKRNSNLYLPMLTTLIFFFISII